jgi:hypothetical protein
LSLVPAWATLFHLHNEYILKRKKLKKIKTTEAKRNKNNLTPPKSEFSVGLLSGYFLPFKVKDFAPGYCS